MSMAPNSEMTTRYRQTLSDFLRVQGEEALYQASILSKEFVEQGIGPEEIVALHSECIETLLGGVSYIEQARMMGLSLQFLLEIMITYGVRYKEYLDLRMNETTRAIQMQVEVERIRAAEAIRLEQARAEERIRAQEDAMRGKEEFLAFIAHELRNPITVIRGSVEYALRRAQQEGSDRVQRALHNAEEGLDRLMHLTNELLILSREEQADLDLRLEETPVQPLIEKVMEANRRSAERKGLTLTRDLQEPVPSVMGDVEWLHTALSNLVDNAIKYTPDGGQVTVRTVTLPRRLQVDVVDTGIGIPGDALPYIFDKYYRVKSGSTAFIKGTGLGLALVKRIVERHGGDVRVQSQEGQGSTFSLYLPLYGTSNETGG